MDTSSKDKVKRICLQMAFLMEHQEILPDLKVLAEELSPTDEYLQGAKEALTYLVTFLEQKGNR